MNYPPKGARNIYTCQVCHHHIVTQDADEGTTPFSTSCKALDCKGMMVSSMYRVFDQSIRASHEWYRPSAPEVAAMSSAVQAHVKQGGLILREARSYIPGMSMEEQILKAKANQ
jgi:hypothetical protein